MNQGDRHSTSFFVKTFNINVNTHANLPTMKKAKTKEAPHISKQYKFVHQH